MSNTERALKLFVGAQMLVATVGTLVLVPLLDIDFEFSQFKGTLLFGALLLAAVADVLIVRFLVIPSVSRRPDATYESILAPAYAYSAAPAMFGVVAAVSNGQPLLGLPFTAISVIAFFSTSNAIERLRLSEEKAVS